MRHMNRRANAIVRRAFDAWCERVHPCCGISVTRARCKEGTVTIILESFDIDGAILRRSLQLLAKDIVLSAVDIVTPALCDLYTGVRWTTSPLSPSYPQDVVHMYTPRYLGV